MLREKYERVPSGCAVSGIMDRSGRRFSGNDIIQSIALMRERSNGLGGGFAAYGIYPEYKDHYAFHMFYDDEQARETSERFLNEHFNIAEAGPIPNTKVSSINNEPIIWRYFALPKEEKLTSSGLSSDEFVAQCVINLNKRIDGAFVVSSGKNMGAFKGVGYPEDIGEFYQLYNYEGYMWTAHGRFPTNTPGWWGGAHPFTLLDLSVVHNGELSSYGANRHYLNEFGYECTMQTDTEVVAYLLDLFVRRQGMPLETACKIMAPPMWDEIERMPDGNKAFYTALRAVYGKAMMNGPFSIIVAFNNVMLALNDRIKLRPLVAAEKGDVLYVSSEESAIVEICANPDRIWAPRAGEPVIGVLEGVKV
ncbi:class II glutamine amidotransferase [Mahella australiensis]|uniref:Glutamate synthase (NADPH) GltB1 subunit n=1 Tax=Mahella australiensis (strain DSM 15567 / CIP 107919 / 50-1 BON) TaxID=697281 RepID=F4A057_MAHA5|nr:glutamine amidotransferase family protein [Mahella australiensis]AEE96891.1 glutamate synthase (NADPH) GltB1 subunit [Mahella australiensis 50-1 BON]